MFIEDPSTDTPIGLFIRPKLRRHAKQIRIHGLRCPFSYHMSPRLAPIRLHPNNFRSSMILGEKSRPCCAPRSTKRLIGWCLSKWVSSTIRGKFSGLPQRDVLVMTSSGERIDVKMGFVRRGELFQIKSDFLPDPLFLNLAVSYPGTLQTR
jgi:hypothetical protein